MGKIRRSAAIILIAPVFVVFSLIAIAVTKIFNLCGKGDKGDTFVRYFISILIAWIYLCLGVRVTVEGAENIPKRGSAVCFFPNHSSLLDIPIVFTSGMWYGIIAKKELFKIPLFHGLLNMFHCLPIDRDNMKESIKTIAEGASRVEKGTGMSIFPEGTRSKSNKIEEFKNGAFKLATKARALVVPVAIKNSRKAFESLDSFRIIHIYVKILSPISTSYMTAEEAHILPEIVKKEIEEAWAFLPGPYGSST